MLELNLEKRTLLKAMKTSLEEQFLSEVSISFRILTNFS